MTREALLAWVLDTYGVEPDYPWMNNHAVLRHRAGGKWFALVMEIPARKLGLNEDRMLNALNVKCAPLLIGALRRQPGYYPAYHMNKDSWITIALDGTVPGEEIQNLVELSYQLTMKKGTKRRETT